MEPNVAIYTRKHTLSGTFSSDNVIFAPFGYNYVAFTMFCTRLGTISDRYQTVPGTYGAGHQVPRRSAPRDDATVVLLHKKKGEHHP